ncbi:MAG: heat-shock protein Hsp20 [Desulfobacterales bacterium]|nr:MAG: heat-shock protein Hsp20 [Desulfobacterales bacterium]
MLTQDLFNLTPWRLKSALDEIDIIRQMLPQKINAGVFPQINVTENADNYYIRAELPGIEPNDLDITATGESFSISGERKIAIEGADVKYHRRERDAGKFSRMFNLPTPIDSGKVSAEFKNGILKVVLPKAESAKPQKITIR